MDQESNFRIARLMAHVFRLQATRLDQLMEHIGLYRGQAILLITLSHCDGQTHSELAEKLQISPAAATKVIKRLEAMSYLRRRPDPLDERVSRVYLLDDGRAVLHRIHNVFDAINRMILNDITPEEQEILRDLLVRIHKNLQDIPVDTIDSHPLENTLDS